MSFKLNKIVKAIGAITAVGALLCSSASVYAAADGPVVRGSKIETNSTLNKVNVEGIPGKGTNVGLNVGVGKVSVGGSYGATTSAQNAEFHSADVSIQSGTVQSSTLLTNSAAYEVSVKGAATTSGNILIGK